MANVTAGAWSGLKPAADITWFEAAAFVNWLGTSTGKQAAYDLTWDGSAWTMSLWSSANAWQLGGENLYRHKDAYYFLPSENEWYKAAYYNPSGSDYFIYPTGSDAVPTAVSSGVGANTAVYNDVTNTPASVDSAGGLSAYGTMGQGGNVWDWTETAFDGSNDQASEFRSIRGGVLNDTELAMRSEFRGGDIPVGNSTIGFRVASVPEPSTYALLLMTGAGALWMARKKKFIFSKDD